MKIPAIVATAHGDSSVLSLRDIDLSWPAEDHDVFVELHVASVNPADIFFRTSGGYVESNNPLVLGHDGMGVVKFVGPAVTSVKEGDRVCFCNGGIGGIPGTYAEAAVIPEWQLAKVPANVDNVTAAALPLIAITAWEALYDRAAINEADWTLVHAGAGGTGHIAIQLAALRGSRVSATVSSTAKARFAKEVGAHFTINYLETDFVREVLRWCGGVNIAFDNVGGSTLQRTFQAMAPYGQVTTLMGLTINDADFVAYNANLSIHNVMMLTPMWKGLKKRLARQAEVIREVLALVSLKKLRVEVFTTFKLNEVAKAHNLMEQGGFIGKVALTIR